MGEFQLAVVVYVPMQFVSFVLLPKWWRLAAIPALIAAPGIFFHGQYMGEVFATMWMIFACWYLAFVWVSVGVVKLIRRSLENRRRNGWEVKLKCPSCGHEGLPEYSGGRTPKPKEWNENSADAPMICANVTCAECGHDLEARAGEKLTELFKDIPKTSLRWPSVILAILCLLPVLPFTLGVLISVGNIGGWLVDWFNWWFWPSLLAPAVITAMFVYIIQPLIYACECGSSRFLFMGMLGQSSCFRCSSCGRLLRRGW